LCLLCVTRDEGSIVKLSNKLKASAFIF
jgi:hypothetical protein